MAFYMVFRKIHRNLRYYVAFSSPFPWYTGIKVEAAPKNKERPYKPGLYPRLRRYFLLSGGSEKFVLHFSFAKFLFIQMDKTFHKK